MELYIHYTALPEGKELGDVVEELNQVLEDGGAVCGGEKGRIDLELEDERHNPKYAQIAVKTCSRRALPGTPRWNLAVWRLDFTNKRAFSCIRM